MTEDDRDFSYMDPAKLLPFTCTITRNAPGEKIERLPKVYIGSDQTVYGGDKLQY